MSPLGLGAAVTAERKKAQRETLRRELAEGEQAEQAERQERAATALRERGKRDAKARVRAHEIGQERIAARNAARDAQTDLEAACSALAAGHGSIERAQALQLARDEARRRLEIWELVQGEMNADPVITGRV